MRSVRELTGVALSGIVLSLAVSGVAWTRHVAADASALVAEASQTSTVITAGGTKLGANVETVSTGVTEPVTTDTPSRQASSSNLNAVSEYVTDVSSTLKEQDESLQGIGDAQSDMAGRLDALDGMVADARAAVVAQQEAEAAEAAEAAAAEAAAVEAAAAEANQAGSTSADDVPADDSSATTGTSSASTSSATLSALPARKTGEERTAAEAVAWLAVQVAATASPDAALTAPGNAWSRLDDARLANEYRVCDVTLNAWHGNGAVASCTQTVAMVVGATVDPDAACMPASGGPDSFMAYITSRPNLFVEVTGQSPEPGDIMCNSGHDCIWVGNELAQTKFPGTNGTVVEAHYAGGVTGRSKYPAISAYGGTDGFRVFRPVAYNTQASHALLDYESLVS